VPGSQTIKALMVNLFGFGGEKNMRVIEPLQPEILPSLFLLKKIYDSQLDQKEISWRVEKCPLVFTFRLLERFNA